MLTSAILMTSSQSKAGLVHKLQVGASSIITPLIGVTVDTTAGSFASLQSALLSITVDPLGMLASKELAGTVVLITTIMSRVIGRSSKVGDAEVNALSQFAVGTAIGLAKPIFVIFVAGSGFCWGYVTVYTVIWWVASFIHVFNANYRSRQDWTRVHQAIKHPTTLQAVMWQITPSKTWGWEQDSAVHLRMHGSLDRGLRSSRRGEACSTCCLRAHLCLLVV